MNDFAAIKRELADLTSQHRDLDDRIKELIENAAGDQLEVQRLKKRKLAIKDRIAKLKSKLLPDIIA